MASPTIESIRVGQLTVPLKRAWGPDVRSITVLPVEVRCDDGVTGYGFSWTPTVGAGAVQAMIQEDLASWWVGRLAWPSLWYDAWAHVHEAGGGGITTIALAGIDLALWDAVARRAQTNLPGMLGRRHESLPVYGSGLNLHYTVDELVEQARRWVDRGYQAVKVKVDLPDPDEDLERMRAVREVIGPDRDLMLDAGQRWDLAGAERALARLREVRPRWVEEPLRSDDLSGYRKLAARVDIPIAAGENLYTVHDFRDAVDAGVSVLQPDVVRVGGITPFVEIAREARFAGKLVAPHMLFELSAQVGYALPKEAWIEDVEDARFADLGVLSEVPGFTLQDGRLSGGPAIGLGIRFAERTQGAPSA